MRVTLIHNPVAGDDEEPDANELMGIIRAAGHDLAYRSAKDGDWSASLEDPGDLVVVAGGDGTVGRVARRLIDTGIPLTLLPIGTANNVVSPISQMLLTSAGRMPAFSGNRDG